MSEKSPLFGSASQGGLQLVALVLSKAMHPFSFAGVGGSGIASCIPHVGGCALGQAEFANPSGLSWDAFLKVVLFDM